MDKEINNIFVNLSDLNKSYNSNQAIFNISFSVKKGELFGLIGPDGAGKSTIFRILATLLLPDSGSATINGFDVIKNFKELRTILGYMPGRFSLYQDLTVEENLEFFATVFGTTISENYDLIRDIYIQIEPFKKRRAGKLSGGMKQKLALSCALIHKPELLILDEPTTGVDAVSRCDFWEMLKKLKKQGITIIVSTPYMDEAGMCDRVALIQQGKIMKIDKPSEIISQFDKQLYAVRSDNIYKLLNDLRLNYLINTAFAYGQLVHITFKEQKEDTQKLKILLEESGHSRVKIYPIASTIEDCFMDFMITKRNE